MAISKIILNGDVQMDVTGDTVDSQYMVSGKTATKADGTKVNGSLTARSSSDLTASGATVTVPAGVYSSQATKSVATATQATPSVSVNTSTGLITATATQTAGYVLAGSKSGTSQLTVQAGKTVTPTESEQTAVAAQRYTTGAVKVAAIPSDYIGSGVTTRSSSDLTVSGATVTAPAGYYGSVASKSVTSGTAGTPTATKGTVSNNSVSVTPSVTNTTGYITGSTKTGTAVTVTASELVSGTKSITENGTGIDVSNYKYVDISVSGGGSGTYALTNIVPQQTIATTTSNMYGYVGVIPSYTEYIQSGKWYLVTYDNTTYVCTGYYGANSEILVGDYQLITSNVEWMETPFIVEYNLTNGYFFLGSRVSGNHSLKVDRMEILDEGVTLVNKTITSNGTYTASSDGADGYDSVTVAVAGGGGNTLDEFIERTISGTLYYSGSAEIPTCAFALCPDIDAVNMPNVSTIRSSAFASCNSLISINLPNVTVLQAYVFADCYNLTTISMDKLESIGTAAFRNCQKLSGTLNLSSVKSIGTYAFSYCTKLQSVIFPNLERMETDCFASCISLEYAEFPKVSIIPTEAFSECSALISVSIPSATSINSGAFYKCSKLRVADFQNAIRVSESAFQYCAALSEISFPNLLYIGSNAFYSCSKLSGKLEFPSVSVIYGSAFYGASLITAFKFMNLRSLMAYALRNLGSSCKYIIMSHGYSLSGSIGTYAFTNCYSLRSLYLLASTIYSLANSNAFSNTAIISSGNIFVPSSLYNSYTTAANWSLISSRFISLTDAEIEQVLATL